MSQKKDEKGSSINPKGLREKVSAFFSKRKEDAQRREQLKEFIDKSYGFGATLKFLEDGSLKITRNLQSTTEALNAGVVLSNSISRPEDTKSVNPGNRDKNGNPDAVFIARFLIRPKNWTDELIEKFHLNPEGFDDKIDINEDDFFQADNFDEPTRTITSTVTISAANVAQILDKLSAESSLASERTASKGPGQSSDAE